jgi:hypothetical protein
MLDVEEIGAGYDKTPRCCWERFHVLFPAVRAGGDGRFERIRDYLPLARLA